jgi:hypothetical protein
MSWWKAAVLVAVVGLAVSLWAGVTMAQEAPGGRGGRRGWGPGGGGWDPEQMRQQMSERMREMLGATEEEWAVIGPLLEKVQTLQREATGGFGFMFGRGRGDRRFGRRGGDEEQAQAQEEEQTPLEAATQALRDLLENEEATPEQIKEALTAYREAREAARQELAKAQEELRALLSMRQEAQLVLMGTLD